MLGWNLVLAWIPFLLSVMIRISLQLRWLRWLIVPVLAAVWLIFLPNAPYLLTDLIHLKHRAPVPYWYDIAMLSMFGCTGILLGVRSLEHIHELIEDAYGRVAGWMMSTSVALLCGLGIYIGRFLRWNSWDLVTRPKAIFADMAARFLHPTDHVQTWGFTIVFGVSLLTLYAAMRSTPRAHTSAE